MVKLSPELNTLIGIRGSGKSSILEGIRYALDIPFGEKASDRDYKENLVSNLLKSGGKITVDAVCRHGRAYQIVRIFGQEPQVILTARSGTGWRYGKRFCISQCILARKICPIPVPDLNTI